ncbi:hypothetical protein [Photobacterium leiognathi]|uniref:hypothetical protein n=1 Tax=Photobacterium leiognathi TaxID=553611 RepID=UPI002981E863|nr:hypothetical protein [Photobacterium leiognathi]
MIQRTGSNMRYCLAQLRTGDKTYKELLTNSRFHQSAISRAINKLIATGKVKESTILVDNPNNPLPLKMKVFSLVQN